GDDLVQLDAVEQGPDRLALLGREVLVVLLPPRAPVDGALGRLEAERLREFGELVLVVATLVGEVVAVHQERVVEPAAVLAAAGEAFLFLAVLFGLVAVAEGLDGVAADGGVVFVGVEPELLADDEDLDELASGWHDVSLSLAGRRKFDDEIEVQ